MQTMKSVLISAFFIAGCLTVFGELTEKELEHFESNLEICGIRAVTWKDSDRRKFEMLEVNTAQSEDDITSYDMSQFHMRLAVELTDKEKNTYLVQFAGNAPEDYDSEYQGEDYWELYMAHGDFGRLKISAYIVQYGVMDGETFVSLAIDEDDAEDMLEKVRAGETTLFPGKLYLRHYYMYDDSSEGVTESIRTNIRQVN